MSSTEELIRRAQAGDRAAGEQLISENSGLIWSVARRFIGRGTETEDLYQLGCLGFLKAIEGFDTEFGTQFSTYAVPKIAGEIRRFLRDDGAIKVSRTLKEQSIAIKSMRSHLTAALGREPTLQEISRQTGLTPEEIAMAETATAGTESIHRTIGDDGFSLENILADTESEETMLERIALRQAIEKLPEREALVINLRYFHALTQDRIAKVLSVSQVQVSRIEKKALSRLREYLYSDP
jgi:RNA polymerase sporulation-specific sigma factor